jgi:[NiFe] hydrogenase assembly HybE family chaperone
MNPRQQERVATLVQTFAAIGSSRMRGIPLLNQQLKVQAVGFEPSAQAQPELLVGILVTPWFMNLICLPTEPTARVDAATPTGITIRHSVGSETFDFISSSEDGLGDFAACSLFSPMFEFSDQAGAVATATEILATLRRKPAPLPQADIAQHERPIPSRRGFLLGRGISPPPQRP